MKYLIMSLIIAAAGSAVAAEPVKPYSVTFHVGTGQDGFSVAQADSLITVREKTVPVLGFSFCTEGKQEAGGCFTVLSNRTLLLGFKFGMGGQ